MPMQRLHALRRAVLLQISRAGEDAQPAGAQRARMNGRITQRTDANGNIRAFFQ